MKGIRLLNTHKWSMRFIALFLCFVFVLTSIIGSNIVPAEAAGKKQINEIKWKKPNILSLYMKKGSRFRLKGAVNPKAAKISYKSSKKKTVAVTKKGVLKAKKKGTAIVTATVKYGNKKSIKLKVVVVKKLVKSKKITLTPSNLQLAVNGTVSQKSAVLHVSVSPKKSTVKKVVYLSSDSRIASVSASGKVTAKKAGYATITAYSADGRGAKGISRVTVKSIGRNVTPVIRSPIPTQVPTTKPTDNLKTTTPATTKPTETPIVNPTKTPDIPTETPAVNPTGTPAVNPTETPAVNPTETPAVNPTGTPASNPPIDTEGKVVIAENDSAAPIYIDESGSDYAGLNRVAASFAGDVKLITNLTAPVSTNISGLTGTVIIVGSIGNNDVIDSLIAENKIDISSVKNKWEVYQIDVVKKPVPNIEQAIVVTGSDKRGAIYGLYHISELMGVSPWVYWGDVNPVKRPAIAFDKEDLETVSKEPSVKYRGIFLNDEAPSLSSWVQKFGSPSFNEDFYEHVFELILRLKGNYLWPAMWNNAFGQDGKSAKDANLIMANEYGIVMGTSHHEPMMRAEQEFKREKYGSGEWNYATNKAGLQQFWNESAVRGKGLDSLITLGMRGEADSPMLPNGTVEDNVNLLKDIITDQKKILADNEYTDTPTILALYKEVEQFWYGGNGVPGLKDWDVLNDVTVMLTEDNFGNIRTLPTEANKNRTAGWGMYYHFDYHGGPRSYEWVNTVPLTKVWEQMSMAYDYGVKDVWIVNAGDLKPMEMNISYFLDMAYDFDTYGTSNVNSAGDYVKNWTEAQFKNDFSGEDLKDISYIVEEYAKINGIRKPEIVIPSTYSIENYNEAMTMLKRLDTLIETAERVKGNVTPEAQAAYYQLVYFPAVASANVHRMQIYAGLNQFYYKQKRISANIYGYLLNQSIAFDKELADTYNNHMPGVGDKWKGMMSSNHVGYSAWNDTGWSYPAARTLEAELKSDMVIGVQGNGLITRSGSVSLPDFTNTNQETYYVDIANTGGEAFDYTAEADNDWITLTKTSGKVISQDTLGVSVDFSKVTANSTGKITVTGAGKTIELIINAKVTDISALSPMTFIEDHGYISIEAKHFSDNQAAGDGAAWTEIKNYGKTESSFKVLPSKKTYGNTEDAPYLEYKVYIKENGTYTLQTYVAPSNNVDWDYVGMKYGVKIDGGAMEEIDSIDSLHYSAGVTGTQWQDHVMLNARITSSAHTLDAGEHTIRIYSVDPELVLQKLVLYSDSAEIKNSYFGPPESYYVGSEKKSVLTADIQDQVYILPAVIEESAMPADVLVPKETDYIVKVNAASTVISNVDVLWNEQTIGSIEVNGSGDFDLENPVTLPYEKGILSYKVSSGDADVNSIQITFANPSIKYKVPEAENENEFYLDLNESQTAGTAAINNKVPESVVSENKVTFQYAEWAQRVNFELAPEQLLMLRKASGITVEINGTSSTEARFRYSLGDPSTQQNWNGTNVINLDTLSNNLNMSLSFSGNINTNNKVYDFFILQLGNSNSAKDPITSADVTIESIKITCKMPAPTPDPSSAYKIPEAADANEFYLDLNDCLTAGNPAINANVPAADISPEQVVYHFTEWKQRLNLKLTSEQIQKLSESTSITVTIAGTSSTDARFRYSLGNPLTQQSWNGTEVSSLDKLSNILVKPLAFTANKSDLTTGYFILQLGNPNGSAETITAADVTLQSVKITCVR